MRQEYDSYIHKFDSPFTAYLHEQSLDGTYETAGDTGIAEHICLMGRNLLCEDSLGFVWRVKYPSRYDASLVFDQFAADFPYEEA